MTPEKISKILDKSKYQKNINIYETFSNEEIKILTNLTPEINILFKSSSNKKNFVNKIFNQNNIIYSPLLISKKIFYKLILGEIQKHFLKERNNLMSKIISLLIKEIASLSKIIEENSILNKFVSQLENRKVLNLDNSQKSKVLNLLLYDISFSKTENEIKEHLRTKSERQYNSSFELNRNIPSKSLKLLKGVQKNINSKINKKLFQSNDILSINKENGGTGTNNNLNSTINITTKESDNSFSKNKKTINKSKKVNNNEINKNKVNNYTLIKNNVLYKNRILNKRKNNFNRIQAKMTENNNNSKNISRSINKRNINNAQINKYEKRIINSSYTDKKADTNLTNKNENIISPNISIVTFLNNNPDILNKIEATDFDIFNLDEKIGRENTLSLIGYYIFNRFGFYNVINYNNFEKWCKKISEGYLRTNPYHTDLHAADITHTCLIYFKIGKVNEICKFSKISKCSLFLSCICHDYKHPGVNNNYLKETKNELSLTYNDNSILENMHISQTFKLMNSNDEFNIFNNVDINTYKQMRKEMISCVLATDMSFHNVYVDFMKEQINLIRDNNNNKDNNEDKEKKSYQNYMNLLIHSADISNPTKPFDIYFKWAKLVVTEFYEQGDKEKELGMVCSCDRNKTTIYQSQLGFINYIEMPFFSLFADLFKKLKFYYDSLNDNKNILIEMQNKENNKNNDDKSNNL